jgi:adenine-specific DNA-methyltransferase
VARKKKALPRSSKKSATPPLKKAEDYRHPESDLALRPEVGTQAQFRKRKPPVKYRYDSSLSPALDWDGKNPARALGEWLLRAIEDAAKLPPPHRFPEPREFKHGKDEVVARVEGLEDALAQLRRIEKPFLNWAGKAERLSFDVPTLPLFVHERLSTQAIIETLKGHRKSRDTQLGLFADPQHSITEQVLKAYEHRDRWVNRMILGDSLVVMNSLLHYEGLGGQVQMIYMDPPYGVRFGSNFQPFVRKRDVKHNEDDDMTREPEMVQAYRDTWELGLHSYLTYLRDRLLLSRELLHTSGSIFVQISDENLHHVKEVMDSIFGAENFCALIAFAKTTSATAKILGTVTDYLLWYSRDIASVKYHQVYITRPQSMLDSTFTACELEDGTIKAMSPDGQIPEGGRRLCIDNLYSMGETRSPQEFTLGGKTFKPRAGYHWKTTGDGLRRLAEVGRLHAKGSGLFYKRYADDFPFTALDNVWQDTQLGGWARQERKLYAVQTSSVVLERCVLMTSDPGDLVLDPTCGSGTTAYVAEQWGRRWITIDVSRVPLALARQRFLTSTFPWYELKDDARGPAGGFVYKRKQNQKGEEVGGIVPHITLKSIASDEEPEQEVLVDRPEKIESITRVTGPFVVEATIPTPVDWESASAEATADKGDEHGSFVDRMLEVLRKSPILRLDGKRTVTLRNVRPPAKTLSLSAEAMVSPLEAGPVKSLPEAVQASKEKNGRSLPFSDKPVAIVFGPENGAVSEMLVYEAAREAHAKDYAHLFVIGFAIQPTARELVDNSEKTVGIPATYVQATPDLMMGDLLKNMRSSEIFSVCGLPEVKIHQEGAKTTKNGKKYRVELLGLDVFDPSTKKPDHRNGDDVPAWFLDTDYNGLCFHVCQAFFPRTGAWESLKKALKGIYDESVWDHLAGTVSAPFEAGETGKVAVKVIDDRGNELLVVKDLKEAEK